ncbi:DUF4160 domain-containing protein [Rhizobium helianthi]|uniref:DUF4160 domain-containing protein n=1 Tax=Rhizobium helianthi TaxID=1132695 RepID=A0ABW4M8H2_9HYPH
MPTVFTFNGLRVVIYLNDHRPAHVHVLGNGCQAIFIMNCPDGPPTLRENMGFKARELASIARSLHDARKTACDEWTRLHGAF